MWFQVFLWVASFIVSDYFRQRLPSQTPSGIGDFNIPTATEGRVVPLIPGGKPQLRSLNCIWYGDFVAVARTVTTGLIFRRDEEIGFTYELALQYAASTGQVAGITGVWLGDDELYRGAPLSVVDIDRGDLFGGEDSGGGFVARIRLFDGADDQPVSAYLASRLDPLPAYRGTNYVMVTNLAETAGANIGERNQLRHLRLELQAYDVVAGIGLGDELGLGNDHHIIGDDANPISVAYNVYASTSWGRSKPVSEINLSNFRAAAETCFTEGIGFTLLIDESTTHDDILDTIEQHIDGYFRPNPITNQIEVRLARQDYIPANEYQANASNILEIIKWDKGDWSETFNRVRVRYTDRAKQWNETHAIARSPGNRRVQGRTRTRELRFQGCHTASVASLLAHRARRALAIPVRGGTIALDRTSYLLRPYDVFVLTSPKAREVAVPVRISKVEVGDAINNMMVFDVVVDNFGTEVVISTVPPPTDFVPPIQSVAAFASSDQAAATVPYTMMQYDSQSGLVPRIITFARRGSGSPIQYEVIRRTRPTFGTGAYSAFASAGFIQAGFCTVGTLRAAAGAWESGNGTLTMQIDPIGAESLDGLIAPYSPQPGNAAGIAVISPGEDDEEWISFDSIVDDGAGIRLEGLYRSSFDSPMESHAMGAQVWFVWTGGMGLPDETFTAGQGVEVKLLPSSPNDAVLEPAAIAIPEIDMLNTIRHSRPLLPRKLDINSTEFPTIPSTLDFAAQSTPTVINGLLFGVEPKLWNSIDVIRQVQGLDLSGAAITDSTWTALTVNIEYWLYNLDATPTPVRGVDELVTGTLAWDTASKTFVISKADVEAAGIAADFTARIEIEIEHSPAGETANQISKEPMLFDFDVTGTFGVISFLYSEVAFHSHFDGVDAATTAVDNSNQNATMTFVGNAQIDTAQSVFGGTALLLDGTGDYVTAPDHAVFNLAANDFTLECRMRFNGDPTAGNDQQAVMSQWDSGGVAERCWIIEYRQANLRFYYSANGSTTQSVDRAWVPVADTWYHIVIARVGNVVRMFVDGLQIGADVPFDLTLNDSAAPFAAGSYRTVSGFIEELNGWIDEVRIINGTAAYTADFTVPTAPFEFHLVSLLAGFDGADAATTFTSEDKGARTATFVGNAQIDTAQSRFGGASLLLDGTGDSVTFPDSPDFDLVDGDFTVECFVRFNSLAGNQYFVSQWVGGGQQSWSFGRNVSGGQLVFVWSTNGSNVVFTGSNWNPTTDVWYHITACRSGADLRIFVDGVQNGTTFNIGTTTIFSGTSAVEVGAQDGTNFLNGHIEEVRVSAGIAHYTAAFTPPAAAFPRS